MSISNDHVPCVDSVDTKVCSGGVATPRGHNSSIIRSVSDYNKPRTESKDVTFKEDVAEVIPQDYSNTTVISSVDVSAEHINVSTNEEWKEALTEYASDEPAEAQNTDVKYAFNIPTAERDTDGDVTSHTATSTTNAGVSEDETKTDVVSWCFPCQSVLIVNGNILDFFFTCDLIVFLQCLYLGVVHCFCDVPNNERIRRDIIFKWESGSSVFSIIKHYFFTLKFITLIRSRQRLIYMCTISVI